MEICAKCTAFVIVSRLIHCLYVFISVCVYCCVFICLHLCLRANLHVYVCACLGGVVSCFTVLLEVMNHRCTHNYIHSHRQSAKHETFTDKLNVAPTHTLLLGERGDMTWCQLFEWKWCYCHWGKNYYLSHSRSLLVFLISSQGQ